MSSCQKLLPHNRISQHIIPAAQMLCPLTITMPPPVQRDSASLDPLILFTVLSLLPSLNTAVLVEILLYGIHLVLFLICVYILLKRKAMVRYVILISVVVMFALSTADVAITLRLMLKDLPALLGGKITTLSASQHIYPKNPIFVTNNFISDLLLIYRCYIVWGKHLAIIVISVVLLLADTIWGWIGAGLPFAITNVKYTSAYLWSTLAMNVLMTALTAGRNWWVNRSTTRLREKGHVQVYNATIAVLIESGLIYSIAILIALLSRPVTFRMTMIAVVYRTVAITPTLMVVQVGLGWHFRPANLETGSWNQENAGPVILDTIHVSTEHVQTEQRPSCEAVAETQCTSTQEHDQEDAIRAAHPDNTKPELSEF